MRLNMVIPPINLQRNLIRRSKALAAALRSANSTDRAALRDALDRIEFVESPLGLLTFDDNRNPDYASVIQIVENGQFVIFQ